VKPPNYTQLLSIRRPVYNHTIF